EGVGADELGKGAGLVRLGLADWAHLVEGNRHPHSPKLPGGLAACKSTANHMNSVCHGRNLAPRRFGFQGPCLVSPPSISVYELGKTLNLCSVQAHFGLLSARKPNRSRIKTGFDQ